jgi:hypothetical protein
MPKQKEIIQAIVAEHVATLPIGTGDDGLSAYQLAVQEGYSGTLQEWLVSLRGRDGTTPVKGIDYNDGATGSPGYTPIKGVDYFDGNTGTPGQAGYTPIKGVDYSDGSKGDKGDPGAPGSDATVTKSAVESVLIGEIDTHTHPGGTGGLSQQQILRMI